MRIINAFAPSVPMWEIYYFPEEDKTWITPIICIAVVETHYTRVHPGEERALETELRPLGFMEANPMVWMRGMKNLMPWAMPCRLYPTPKSEKWAGEIADLQRQHEVEKTK